LAVRPSSLLEQEVHHLVELLNRHALTELEVERKGLRIRISRLRGSDTLAATPMETAFDGRGQPTKLTTAPAGPPVPEKLVTITSPIVGTFYRAPSPDADPYVEEGDLVRKGQVLCIVEAMKLMNEIESEVDGRIYKILVESAKPVEYGQPLFLIEPTGAPEG
jgi:acetyl-CoA carboxylase biotin carboxyl carrier protein